VIPGHLEAVRRVGIDEHVVAFPGVPDGSQPVRMAAGAGHHAVVGQGVPGFRPLQVETAPLVHLGPEFPHHSRVPAHQVEDEAFEIGGLGNVHGGAGGDYGFIQTAGPVNPGTEKLVQHIVFVGSQNQLADGQAHLTGDVASADIAEIARRHGKGHPLVIALGGGEIALEVIDHLGGDSSPVDGIHRADLVLGLEFGVVGNGFDDVLGFVEHAAPDGDIEDIGILEGVHLGPLEGAHLAFRGKHEDPHPLLAPHGVFGGGTCVPGGGPQDIQGFAPLGQHVFKKIAQELHGHIFESQGRAIGQFQQGQTAPPVLIGFQPAQGNDLLGILPFPHVAIDFRGIGLETNGVKVFRRNVVNELGENAEGQLPIGQGPPFLHLRPGHPGVGFRQIEAPIGSQTA